VTAAVEPAVTPSGHNRRWSFHGPFARWPRASDAVLAATIFLVTVFLVDGPGDSVVIRRIADVPIPALLVIAVASAALYRRRHEPLVVLGIALAGSAVTIGSEHADVFGAVTIALYSAGRYAKSGIWSLAGLVAALGLLAVDGLVDDAPLDDTVPSGIVMFLAFEIGRWLRLRIERRAQVSRERTAEGRRVVTEERARIARELHDVVAHRVSLMTVQAGAAKSVVASDPDAALTALTAVEEAGRQALSELRHLLGVLRPDRDLDDLGPQPALADLPRLVEQIRGAGLDLSLDTVGMPAELPSRVDLFAFRIVQEALTNVLKHAGPGTHAEVRLAAERGGILVDVLDHGPATGVSGTAAGAYDARGHGIVGMRERALLLGGTLDAGPRPGGGFRVVAYLPTEGETA
jgi:signal transduction histidine kinase